MSQGLRGFVAQGMDGRKKQPVAYSATIPVGTRTWTAPATGTYLFVLWGGGAAGHNGSNGGGSGAHVQARRRLLAGQTVSCVVGAGGDTSTGPAGTPGGNTSVTMPNGELIFAGGGQYTTSAGGSASGNTSTYRDILINGSAGGVSGGSAALAGTGDAGGSAGTGSGTTPGGAGAPGSGAFRGGDGANGATTIRGGAPGGGGAVNTGIGTGGGDGMLVIQKVA